MKKILPALLMLACISCKKNDSKIIVQRGQIVTVDAGNSAGKAIHGPYRVDSIYQAATIYEDSNWYYLTSNNGVEIKQEGYYMHNCNSCTYTWVGTSQWVPNAYTNGDTLNPRLP